MVNSVGIKLKMFFSTVTILVVGASISKKKSP